MIRQRSVALVAASVFIAVLAACSSGGSSSANGDKTAFCKTNAEIDAEVNKVTSADQLPGALKNVQGKLDTFLSTAPSEVKADAQLLVDAARKAISTNDVTAFQNDSKLQAAGTHVNSFCGQSNSSSSS